ncbi:hypothetical protein DL768_009389 [Monosporascus sp. mg162]|nr:hypothetical protein DL768_009389 [Monosporascus sp. mg162]
MSFSALWQQFFPPAPTFTEEHIVPGSQVGKVFIVTGANSGTVALKTETVHCTRKAIRLTGMSSGIGLALVKLLYPTGATIYLAGRSPERIQNAITEVTSILSASAPATPAILKSLHLDLSDLTTVKPAAASFAAQETRLDILWNNAGVGCPPETLTKQGLEIHIGANCVAPLLFTQELLPLLRATARSSPENSVRVVWSGSLHIDMTAPKGGVDFERIEHPRVVSRKDYAASKAGNWFLAVEGAKRWGSDGIISVCENPGNLYTGFYDREPWLLMLFLKRFVLYETRYGAYTMLFAGLSPEVGNHNGAYIWPWGRIQPIARPDILKAASDGKAKALWEWCEKAWQEHV